jgi:transcriptional regulator with XRE-family HTH domain
MVCAAMNALRRLRLQMDWSQSEFARRLGVAEQTYRTWDAGRRTPPRSIVSRAKRLQETAGGLLPMQLLADEYRIHVRTLRKAAQDGRLQATFSTAYGVREARGIRQSRSRSDVQAPVLSPNHAVEPAAKATRVDDPGRLRSRARHTASRTAADAERTRKPNWCGEQGRRVSMGIEASTAFTGVVEARPDAPLAPLEKSARKPLAVLESPVELRKSAWSPLAVLASPVVLWWSASMPLAVLKEPVVLSRSAHAPFSPPASWHIGGFLPVPQR